MEAFLRVVTDGPVLLLGGIVLLVFGAAGLLAGGGAAAYSRMRTARPVVFLVQIGVGVLLLGAGLAAITAG